MIETAQGTINTRSEPIRSRGSRSAEVGAWAFRLTLLVSAVGLALFIPYKYLTQLHAVTGLYAWLFPLSSLLAAAGIVFAVKPRRACDCSVAMRGAIAGLAVGWLATGLMCVGALNQTLAADAVQGSIATVHMLSQHVFLSLALIAMAWVPRRMAALLESVTPQWQDPLPAGVRASTAAP